ncbi:MAG: trypsin-like peptidase domain-containing protein [Pirellulales bacterium]|nr:trypsin-like peptidase domain-containing protein [Pirellulales bacterium]
MSANHISGVAHVDGLLSNSSSRLFLSAVFLGLVAVTPTSVFATTVHDDLGSDSRQSNGQDQQSVDKKLLEYQAKRVEIVERARSATVAVFGRGGRGGGSGVLISPDGYALSNFHVTDGAGDAMQCGLSDGKLYDAVIVGIDPTGDVALIKLLGRDDFPCAPLGDSDQLKPGDGCYAMGNPFLLATDFRPTVTFGIVSGVHRYQYPANTLLEYADCIQTDASINPGNSGGPLFNMDGEVVGINGRGSFEKRGRVNVGVGYAISINQIKYFMGYLRSGRIVDHATLGAIVATASDGRIRVADILDNSDAYRRGLRYDDELVAFGGRPIYTTNGFKNVLGIFPKGWRVPLTFRRDGTTHDIYVRLMGVHREDELIEKAQGRRPQQPQPKPDEGDKDKKPGDQQPATPASSGMPEHVAAVFEARRGYTNYHFNRLEQERVWQMVTAAGPLSPGDSWNLQATIGGGLAAAISISSTGATLELPGGKAELTVDPERPVISDSFEPVGSGGLIAALYCWRRFMCLGVDGFGLMYYQGEVPMSGYLETSPRNFTAHLVDCLVGEHGGAECRFLVDPSSGQLLALEFYPEKNSDPCEVRFSNFQQIEGRVWPTEIQVRFGNQTHQKFQVTGVELAAAGQAMDN